MKIKTRLYSGVIISAIVLMGVTSAIFVVTRLSEKALRTSAGFSELEHQVFALNLLSKSYLVHSRERVREQWESVHQSLGNRLNEMKLERPSQASLLTSLLRDHEEVALSFAQLVEVQRSVQDTPLILNLKERLENRIAVQLNVMLDHTSKLVDMLNEGVLISQRRVNFFIAIAISVVAVIGALLFLSTNRVLRSLLRIHEATDFISKEQWDHKIEVRGHDEVGQVARAFNNMAQRLGESYAALEVEIAEHKRTEEELLRSNTDLEEFAHIASHDLKEPLRKVRAFGDMLTTKCSDSLSEEGRDYLGRMQNAAERMENLLDSLLAYSRAGKKPEPFAPVDLNKSVREALSNLEVLIQEKEAAVAVEQLPTVRADPVQMIQLFQNLIGNALKFQRHGERPHIRIYIRPNGNRRSGKEKAYEICVEDNGIGFDEKYVSKIFVPFQRLHGRSEYEGFGIGLAICRKIVGRHGGTITARSIPGKGSTFLVTLPVEKVGESFSTLIA